jgi:hypothetical protein
LLIIINYIIMNCTKVGINKYSFQVVSPPVNMLQNNNITIENIEKFIYETKSPIPLDIVDSELTDIDKHFMELVKNNSTDELYEEYLKENHKKQSNCLKLRNFYEEEANNNNPHALNQMGCMYECTQWGYPINHKKSIQYFLKAMIYNSSWGAYNAGYSMMSYNNCGSSTIKQMYELAKGCFKKSILLYDKYPGIYATVAELHKRQNNIDKAIKYYEKYFEVIKYSSTNVFAISYAYQLEELYVQKYDKGLITQLELYEYTYILYMSLLLNATTDTDCISKIINIYKNYRVPDKNEASINDSIKFYEKLFGIINNYNNIVSNTVYDNLIKNKLEKLKYKKSVSENNLENLENLEDRLDRLCYPNNIINYSNNENLEQLLEEGIYVDI